MHTPYECSGHRIKCHLLLYLQRIFKIPICGDEILLGLIIMHVMNIVKSQKRTQKNVLLSVR